MAAATFEQEFLRPGTYQVDGEDIEITAEDLREWLEGTKQMIDGGLSVPVIFRHDPSDSGSPQFDEDDARDCAGWLRGVSQNEDGSVSHKLEITDPEAAKKIADGSIKFTSPDLRQNFVDGKGRNWGKVIRHVALTPTPRNPDQGKFQQIEMGMCFSLADLKPAAKHLAASTRQGASNMARDADDKQEMEFAGPRPGSQDAAMWAKVESAGGKRTKGPSKKGGKPKGRYTKGSMKGNWEEEDEREEDELNFDAIRDGADTDEKEEVEFDESSDTLGKLVPDVIDRLELELPDGIDLRSDEGLALLATAVLNKLPAKPDKGEFDEEDELDESEVEAASPLTFSEDVLKKMSPTERAMAKQLQAIKKQNMQFAEDRRREIATTGRERLIDRIKGDRGLPRAAREFLLSRVEGVRFSEDREPKPSLTIEEAVTLVKKSIPEVMRMAEDARDKAEEAGPSFETAQGVNTLKEARKLNKSLKLR